MYTFTVNFAVSKKTDGTIAVGKCYCTKKEEPIEENKKDRKPVES